MSRTASRTTYSPEIADKILGRMIAGLSVTRIARQPGMPAKSSIMKWVETRPDFREVYLRAQEGRGCTYAEKAVECENELDDIIRMMMTRRISTDIGRAMIYAVRVKIDTFKWAAGRMAPKIFGSQVEQPEQVDRNMPAPAPTDTSAVRRRFTLQVFEHGERPALKLVNGGETSSSQH